MLYYIYMIQGGDQNGNEAEEDAVDTNDIDAKEESVLTNGKAHDAEPNKKRQKKRWGEELRLEWVGRSMIKLDETCHGPGK